jgi:hypothetical protein
MKACYTLLTLCVLCVSCFQEELEPADYEFRGNWDSERYAIQIFMNGSAMLDIRNRGRLEGYVKIKGDRMIFQSQNEDDEIGYKSFDIDQRPSTDANGVTFMILDGHRLERF